MGTGTTQAPVEKMEEIADYFNVDLNYLNGKSDYTTLIVPGDVAGGYYINDDVKRIANEIAKDSDLMLLFKTAKHAGPEGLKIATDMLEALRRKEEGDTVADHATNLSCIKRQCLVRTLMSLANSVQPKPANLCN